MMRSPSSASLHQEVAQALRRDDDGLDVAERRGVDQRRAAGKLGQLAHEIAWAVGDDQLPVPQAVVLLDRYFAGEDDEEPRRDLAGAHDAVPGRIAAAVRRSA
ncbi:MAG: hypothetical protein WDM81_04985 [Rhizomicrobium sp.]